jgi:hypothetical protein
VKALEKREVVRQGREKGREKNDSHGTKKKDPRSSDHLVFIPILPSYVRVYQYTHF